MKNITLEVSDTPRSLHFDDIYYNVDGGLAEKYYVFIDGNNLPQRFEKLEKNFNLLELGFGTGLSFLLTAIEFNKFDSKYELNFTSTELYPLSFEEIDLALKKWDDLYSNKITKEFLMQYKQKELIKDIKIKLNNVNLHILVGDARETLKSINEKQNCFYLDGFAPSKNPIMWGEEVFSQVKRLSAENSTATTYSVSRLVKDILTFAGFDYSKRKGFGKKREMIIGIKK
mgnify:CR=1 FL=1